MNWFTFNGMYSPSMWEGVVQGVLLFLVFELITVAIEWFVLSFCLKDYVEKEKGNGLGVGGIVVLMNVASALVAFPVWITLGIGGF